jgi:hypothetical protein
METRKFNTYIDQLLEAHRPHKKQDTRTVRQRMKDGAAGGYQKPPRSKQHTPGGKQAGTNIRRLKSAAEQAENEKDLEDINYIHEDEPIAAAKRDKKGYSTNKHREADVAYKKTLKNKQEDDAEDAGVDRAVSPRLAASIYLERLNQLK